VWFAGFEDAVKHLRWQRAIEADPATAAVFDRWRESLDGPAQCLQLIPTPRSLLRGVASAPALSGVSGGLAAV
jgi:hypothetical protein